MPKCSKKYEEKKNGQIYSSPKTLLKIHNPNPLIQIQIKKLKRYLTPKRCRFG
jgi:hypothetical protein